MVRVAQQANSCGARALGEPTYRVLQASLVELELEIVLDVSRTALTAVPSTAEATVQSALHATFSDPTAIDAAFGDVLRTACTAQGITPSCPNPPSLALRLAPPPPAATSSSLNIPALAGGLAAGLLICVSVLVASCVYLEKKKAAQANPEVYLASPASFGEFSYANPSLAQHQTTITSVFTPVAPTAPTKDA